MPRPLLVAASALVGVSAAVLAYAYLDWRRPILPIRLNP